LARVSGDTTSPLGRISLLGVDVGSIGILVGSTGVGGIAVIVGSTGVSGISVSVGSSSGVKVGTITNSEVLVAVGVIGGGEAENISFRTNGQIAIPINTTPMFPVY
jgi:hypothetical protein